MGYGDIPITSNATVQTSSSFEEEVGTGSGNTLADPTAFSGSYSIARKVLKGIRETLRPGIFGTHSAPATVIGTKKKSDDDSWSSSLLAGMATLVSTAVVGMVMSASPSGEDGANSEIRSLTLQGDGIKLDVDVSVKVDPKTGRVVEVLQDVWKDYVSVEHEDFLELVRPLEEAGIRVRGSGLLPVYGLFTDVDEAPGYLEIKKESINDAIKSGRLVLEVNSSNVLSIMPQPPLPSELEVTYGGLGYSPKIIHAVEYNGERGLLFLSNAKKSPWQITSISKDGTKMVVTNIDSNEARTFVDPNGLFSAMFRKSQWLDSNEFLPRAEGVAVCHAGNETGMVWHSDKTKSSWQVVRSEDNKLTVQNQETGDVRILTDMMMDGFRVGQFVDSDLLPGSEGKQYKVSQAQPKKMTSSPHVTDGPSDFGDAIHEGAAKLDVEAGKAGGEHMPSAHEIAKVEGDHEKAKEKAKEHDKPKL